MEGSFGNMGISFFFFVHSFLPSFFPSLPPFLPSLFFSRSLPPHSLPPSFLFSFLLSFLPLFQAVYLFIFSLCFIRYLCVFAVGTRWAGSSSAQSTKLLKCNMSFPPQLSTRFSMMHSDYLCSDFKETWILRVTDVISGWVWRRESALAWDYLEIDPGLEMVSLVLPLSREASHIPAKSSPAWGALMNACAHLFFPAEDFRLMITGCHMCYLLCIFNKNNNGSNSSSLTLLRSLLLSPLHSVFHLILPLPDEATLEHFSDCIEEGTEAQRISVNFSRSHC